MVKYDEVRSALVKYGGARSGKDFMLNDGAWHGEFELGKIGIWLGMVHVHIQGGYEVSYGRARWYLAR